MNDKFVSYLAEGRGRPKGASSDGKEGIRSYVLIASIDIDGKKKKEEKKLGKVDGDTAEKEAKKWEKELHKKYEFDAEIEIDIEADGEAQTFKTDPHGREGEVEHSFRFPK